jgi:hypothetical protein
MPLDIGLYRMAHSRSSPEVSFSRRELRDLGIALIALSVAFAMPLDIGLYRMAHSRSSPEVSFSRRELRDLGIALIALSVAFAWWCTRPFRNP